jgi:Uma2 family endonuclease
MAGAAAVEARTSTREFFELVDRGVIGRDDRVELLEGVIVAMSPQNPPHASATTKVQRALTEAIGKRAVVRVQLPLVIGGYSVPEPDVAVVAGDAADYDEQHPTSALLVVEVADTSLVQDRLTKAAMYASASIPEYWIVNLVDERLEILRAPDPAARRYRESRTAERGDRIAVAAFPQATIVVDELLPRRSTAPGV